MLWCSPNHSGDRFYKPPTIRRLKQLRKEQLLEAEPEQRRREEEERRRLGSDEADLSGLDDSPAAEGSLEVGTPPPKLANAFKEWSASGAGVRLVMNGSDSVVQYYVPYLSGIQLSVDCSKPPFKTRHLGEETDLDPSQERSTDGSDSENIERCVKLGLRGQKSLAESSLVKIDRLSLSEKPLDIQERFSNDDGESASSSLAFEYMERDRPYSREPLAEKANYISFLMWSSYSDKEIMTRYPIYRIPTGPTLRDLEACFLTYQKLSTPSIGMSNSRGSFSTVKKIVNSADMSPKLSLPVFGLTSYKFKASVWTSNWLNERVRATTLMKAANSWLQNLNVNHQDLMIFASPGTYQR